MYGFPFQAVWTSSIASVASIAGDFSALGVLRTKHAYTHVPDILNDFLSPCPSSDEVLSLHSANFRLHQTKDGRGWDFFLIVDIVGMAIPRNSFSAESKPQQCQLVPRGAAESHASFARLLTGPSPIFVGADERCFLFFPSRSSHLFPAATMQCGLAERSPLTGIHTTSNSSPLGPSLDLVGATTVPRSHLPDVCMSSERLALTATNLPTLPIWAPA